MMVLSAALVIFMPTMITSTKAWALSVTGLPAESVAVAVARVQRVLVEHHVLQV